MQFVEVNPTKGKPSSVRVVRLTEQKSAHSVANGSPLLLHFFEWSCVARTQWRGDGPGKLVIRFGTKPSIMKDLIHQTIQFFVPVLPVKQATIQCGDRSFHISVNTEDRNSQTGSASGCQKQITANRIRIQHARNNQSQRLSYVEGLPRLRN